MTTKRTPGEGSQGAAGQSTKLKPVKIVSLSPHLARWRMGVRPSKKRILVADDNSLCRKIVGRMLAHAGYDVVMAEDGSKTINLLMGSHIDLAVVDLRMPCMHGDQVARWYRNCVPSRKIPIIVMTVDESESARTNAFHAGINGYLVKPVRIRTLIPLVAQLLARADQEREQQVAEANELPSTSGKDIHP